jgi:integrase
MTKALTVRAVEAIRAVKTRREVPDAHMPGLYLIVQPSGAKSWAIRYRHNGRSRKHTLGAYPAIDLLTARELGGQALRSAARNKDPGHEKTRARAAQTGSIEDVVARFVAHHCQRHNRASTARETERLLRKHVLPRWRGRAVHEIARRDVLDLLDRIVSGVTPKTGNSVFAAIRRMFNWCVERDIIATSPCAGVKRPATELTRDRVLDDRELVLVWQATETLGGPFGALVKLLILSGQRRDEAARMEWEELDLNSRLWTLRPERVKTGERHEVPLSDAVLNVIEALPRIHGSPYVLTTDGKSPSSNYGKSKRKLDALLPENMKSWRLHDLRRSCASGMAKLDVSLPVIEKVLNHRSGSFAGIVGVYQRHSFADEKKAALDAWGRHIEGLVSGESAKIPQLRKAHNS